MGNTLGEKCAASLILVDDKLIFKTAETDASKFTYSKIIGIMSQIFMSQKLNQRSGYEDLNSKREVSSTL